MHENDTHFHNYFYLKNFFVVYGLNSVKDSYRAVAVLGQAKRITCEPCKFDGNKVTKISGSSCKYRNKKKF